MADAATAIINKPAWVDLATSDAAAAREFYAKVFGWDIQVNPDPQYGGYGRATIDGKDAAGITPTQAPDASWKTAIRPWSPTSKGGATTVPPAAVTVPASASASSVPT